MENGKKSSRAIIRELEELNRKNNELEEEKEKWRSRWQASEQNYRSLFERALDCLYLHDLEGNFIDVNPAALSLLGYRRDELVGRNISMLVTGDQLTRALETMREIIQTGSHKSLLEFQLKRKDGATVFIECKGALLSRAGKPDAVQGIARDITARKHAEEKLRKSEKIYRAIFNNTGAAVFVMDQHAKIHMINREGEKFLGYSPEEIVSKSWMEFVAPEDLERMVRHYQIWRATPAAAPRHYELRIVNRQGQILNAYLRTDTIAGTDKVVASLLDITAHKQSEAALRRSEQCLKHANKELDRRNRELESILYAASHDLRAPIFTIQGFTELLQEYADEELSEKSKDYVRRIHNASRNLACLLSDLVRITHAEREQVLPRKVSFASVLSEVCEEMKPGFNKRRINFEAAQDFPWVNADPARLNQILNQLLTNALNFLGDNPEPRIVVGYQRSECDLVFYIRDNGIGIDHRDLDKIFNPFYQVREVACEGNGVGLTLAKIMVEQHGGRIWVESAKKQGTTVYFTLPENKLQNGELAGST